MTYIFSLTDTDQFFFWPSGSVKYRVHIQFHIFPYSLFCLLFCENRTFLGRFGINLLDHADSALHIEMMHLWGPRTWNALHPPCVNNKQQSCRCALHTSAVCAFVTANNMQTYAVFVKIRCQSVTSSCTGIPTVARSQIHSGGTHRIQQLDLQSTRTAGWKKAAESCVLYTTLKLFLYSSKSVQRRSLTNKHME